MEDRERKIIDALHDLDNKAFNEGDCTIIFFFGTNDNGERYVDTEMVTGRIIYTNRETHQDLGDFVGAEDLMEAIVELSKDT
jgi:hypothetical protein